MRAALALAVTLLVLAACGRPAEVPMWERPGLGGAVRPGMGSPAPGEIAPDFELPRLDGTALRLSSLRGQWVLLHFTASWCPYCDSEIAHLGDLSDAYAPRGLRVVVVDVKEDAAAWTAYAKAHVAPSILALHDASGDASKRFAPPRAQPSFEDRAQVALDCTLILDPKGTIRLFLMPDSAHFDPTFAAVRRELDRMLAEEPPADERLTPEQVVAIAAAPADGAIVVTLAVRPGYHIMSDRPSRPNYVPTRVHLDPADDVVFETPVYPSPTPFSLGDHSIATFSGESKVKIPFRVAGAAGPSLVKGTVSYQACTATVCLFPVTRPILVALSASR